jgi:predicted dinucleotide-binding enzyme
MRIGILGSGLMGGKLGTIFARAGHEVVFSYARTSEKLKKLARDAQGNARAGTPGEAAKEADAVLLAVHWSRIDDVLKQAGDLGEAYAYLLETFTFLPSSSSFNLPST